LIARFGRTSTTTYFSLLSRSANPCFASRFQTAGQRLHRGRDLQQLRLQRMTSPGARIVRPTVAFPAMPSDSFVARLNEQIGHEFGAHQQYVAIAVHYDAETLPQLARFFYRQALEERDHAMMMVQYLLDADDRAVVPGVAAPQVDFDDIVAPVALALAQEKRVSDQINGLAALAREERDYSSEQFMQWFIKEQIEEIATMSDLLRVVERSQDHAMDIEDYLAREQLADPSDDPTAPHPAGAGG
jgi:ferritin